MEKDQNQENTDKAPEKDQKDLNQDQKTETLEINNKEQDQEQDQEQHQEQEKTPEEKILELEDKLARSFAEMENQRRRFEKEKEDAFEYGGFSFAREALNLIDNLERSKQILLNDETLKNTEALKKTLEHLDIINKDLISIFSKNKIKPIECLNKKLDPNLHQAMIEIEDDQKEPGTIVQEIQKGFTIKDRLLRPALVGVAKKSEKKLEKNEEIKENSGDK